MNDYEYILNIIKSTRQNKNLTSSEFCKVLDVKQNLYSMKENNKTPFTFNQFLIICDYFEFNLKIGYVESGEEHIIKNDYVEIVNAIKERRELLNISKDYLRFHAGMSYPNYLKKEKLESAREFYLNEILKIFKLLNIQLEFNYSYISNNVANYRYENTFKLLKEN